MKRITPEIFREYDIRGVVEPDLDSETCVLLGRGLGTTLARVLWRPAVIPMPAVVLRLALGEMADELLLASTRAVPAWLQREGFPFRHLTLDVDERVLIPRPETEQLVGLVLDESGLPPGGIRGE